MSLIVISQKPAAKAVVPAQKLVAAKNGTAKKGQQSRDSDDSSDDSSDEDEVSINFE